MRPVSPWLATGDLGELGADGVLRVLGRRRPMINRGGFKLSPGEIERVLSADPSVVAARVVVVPHSRLGEAPKALIVLRPDAAPEPLALARRCLDLLGAHWVPVAFEFLSALPPAGPSWKDAP